MKKQLLLLKIHSHPNGVAEFSTVDDESDRDLFASVAGWLDDDYPGASALMLQDGTIKARWVTDCGKFTDISRVAVIGDDIVHYNQNTVVSPAGFTLRHAQLFGDETTSRLHGMRIGVVGASGTGSIVAEMLNRLGVGEMVLVDPDTVEEKNLNRIINSRQTDVGRPKVDCLKEAIEGIGLGSKVVPIQKNLHSMSAIKEVAACDAVFGCVDGAEGRSLINRICAFYLVPYVDVGVRLDADGKGGIDQICGSVHYMQPGGSSMLSRKAITQDQIRAEAMRRTDSEHYEQQKKEGYIKGVSVDRPAVISINMFYASMAVNEFLARIHPFRHDPNGDYAQYSMSIAQMHLYQPDSDGEPDQSLVRYVGRGDLVPLLGISSLSGG